MNSNSLQQNFILFLEKSKDSKEVPRNLNGRLCCEKCRFSTKDIALFERHIAQHEEVTFSCTICNHISYSRVESQRHLVKHKGSFPYKCNWCSYGAVRRDYMVKHIQRIHGKSADGIFANDCTKKIEGTKGLGLSEPRTLSGPSHDVKVVSHSAGNVSGLLSSASQTRPSAPYRVTSTTCSLPMIKPQPYIVTSTTQTVCKVTQGIINPPHVSTKEAIEYIKKRSEKTSLEKTTVTSALPRVHIGISGDRSVQQKPPLQSHVVGTTEKTATDFKTMPKLQAGTPVSNNNHLKTLLSNQREAPVALLSNQREAPVALLSNQREVPVALLSNQREVPVALLSNQREAPVALLSNQREAPVALLSNQREAPVAQMPVTSGAVQNIPVAHAIQWSVPSSANPTVLVDGFRQGIPSIKHVAQPPGKNSQHKARPNILVRTPPMTVESSTKSGVQVGLLSTLNQPSQHNRPLMVSGPEERNPPRSSVQVELLAPLNQPIQHNKPLTVSCPEEITIPAGCLVELVEVKNVNGTRELELRLVPQQLSGPQQKDLKSTTVTSATSRLSFKCRVATDDNQSVNMNHDINTPKANAIPEHLVQRSHLKSLLADDKVYLKNDTEVNGTVLSSRKNGTGSSSKWLHALSRSVASNPSEPHDFMQWLRAEQKKVATEPVKPQSRMHYPIKNISPHARKKNSTAKGLKYKRRAAQPPADKQEDTELSYQGLPVISSVFSLCPIPQETPSHIHTIEAETQISVVSESKESPNTTDNPRVCRPTMKTEDEARLLTDGQLAEKKVETLEEPKVSEDIVKEKLNPVEEKTFASDDEDKISSKLCSSSTDALKTDPSSSMNSSSGSMSDCSSQHEKMETTNLEPEKSCLAQNDSPVASNMNPTVALIRMPSLEFFSLSESATKEKRDSEESVTARPVVCCTSNQQNLQERTIKLVLKRKRSETSTSQDGRIDLVCIDLPPKNKKQKRAKKHKSSKDQHPGNATMESTCLTPLKDDQLIKHPGPNQPVVVLNHPNPHVWMVSMKDQQRRSSTPDLSNQDGTIMSNPVRTCPAFKMTLKKVQGQKYQVTELLLKGVFENTVL
ncbi:hypothetical protein KOW79_001823 [Hemibagrus wyckioides]|uniref:C2H2-type domain-containing protein n=1 Tax=Hemibagrus wyckioides TaxID=337641 RepID=A0A9D3SSP3_9TELE|nr:uncharacterized protein LOC131366494 [Hemibagrus wyckioides]XP_058266972.1 uncharacterized protein LOC131366494 [Hemibagrus wyckioides]KAG7335227.1 hypothetical protein KOW79_001823 [Hemibagrus wyckioides]